MAGKQPDVSDVPAGQPFLDEDRKVVVAPDGATSTFGTAAEADGKAPENTVTTIAESSVKLTKKEQADILEAAGRDIAAEQAEPEAQLPTEPAGGEK